MPPPALEKERAGKKKKKKKTPLLVNIARQRTREKKKTVASSGTQVALSCCTCFAAAQLANHPQPQHSTTQHRRLIDKMTRFTAYPSLVLAIGASWAHAAIDVGTCEQFAAVDRRTETEVTITSADFKCGTYTRLSIRADMVLKSTVGKVTFTNLALKVYGSLTVEPDVVFTGVNLVVSRNASTARKKR